jgi:hypothetical protein
MDNQTDTNGDFKLVALLNKRIEPGKVMNALAHCVAGAVNKLGEEGRAALKFLVFTDAGGESYPSISARSFIVLRGSDGDIRKARRMAKEIGIEAICFTESMTGETYVEQLARTNATPSEAMQFYALVMVGSAELLNPISRKFSLWRDATPS